MISESKAGERVYQGRNAICADCPLRSHCCQSEKGHARTTHTDDKESLRQDMKRKMTTVSAQSVYKQRKVIVEPVFGQIKIGDFVVSACGAKKKSPVNLPWSVLPTISKKLLKPF